MKKKRLRAVLGLVVIGAIALGITGCKASNAGSDEKTITVSGSSSVGPLMEKLAEVYEKNNDISIDINQTGSSAGIKDANDGISQIGMTSRDLTKEENEELNENVIAYDGIAVITNKNNKVKNLSISELKDIYTGKITNWKDVGGDDAPIVVISREEGSGTRATFEEKVGYNSEELLKKAQISDGSGNIKFIVQGNKNAIGFVSFEYLDDSINTLKINNISPTAEEVINGEYPIARSFIVVTKDNVITDSGKNFISWILSKNGQDIVEKSGLIKVK